MEQVVRLSWGLGAGAVPDASSPLPPGSEQDIETWMRSRLPSISTP